MILQSKIVADLTKIRPANKEEVEIKSDDDDDDPFDLEDFNPGAKDQNANKNIFRRNYGLEVQYPGFYILDSKVYPKDIDWVVKVVKFVAPNKEQTKYTTFHTKTAPDVKQEV